MSAGNRALPREVGQDLGQASPVAPVPTCAGAGTAWGGEERSLAVLFQRLFG